MIEYATSKINEKVQENNNELAINGTSDLEVDSKDKDLDVSKNDIQNELEKREEGKKEEGEEKVERVKEEQVEKKEIEEKREERKKKKT
jgi:hypothetical protein